MSTLDVVAGCGARPANFLDIGGGASAQVMADGLSVVLSDPDVKSVLVNVFGGITACDAVADGIVQALGSVRLTKPLVVRLDGNNAVRGRGDPRRARPPAGAAGRPPWTAPRRRPPTGHTPAEGAGHGDLPHQGEQGPRPGHDRRRGHEAHPAHARRGHRRRRRRQPAQGRPQAVDFDGRVPVPRSFGSVARGHARRPAPTSPCVFVPPAFAKAAVMEAADAGIGLAVVITEGIPVHDSVAFRAYAQEQGTRIIGPNCPGLISPGQSNAGIIPADITRARPHRPGVQVRHAHLPTHVRAAGHRLLHLRGHRRRPRRRHHAHRLPGRLRGRPRHRPDRARSGRSAATRRSGRRRSSSEHVTKPVVGYVAGFTAPEGRTMGHAGRHRLRLLGHGAGEEGSAGGGRAYGSATTPTEYGAPCARPSDVTFHSIRAEAGVPPGTTSYRPVHTVDGVARPRTPRPLQLPHAAPYCAPRAEKTRWAKPHPPPPPHPARPQARHVLDRRLAALPRPSPPRRSRTTACSTSGAAPGRPTAGPCPPPAPSTAARSPARRAWTRATARAGRPRLARPAPGLAACPPAGAPRPRRRHPRRPHPAPRTARPAARLGDRQALAARPGGRRPGHRRRALVRRRHRADARGPDARSTAPSPTSPAGTTR